MYFLQTLKLNAPTRRLKFQFGIVRSLKKVENHCTPNVPYEQLTGEQEESEFNYLLPRGIKSAVFGWIRIVCSRSDPTPYVGPWWRRWLWYPWMRDGLETVMYVRKLFQDSLECLFCKRRFKIRLLLTISPSFPKPGHGSGKIVPGSSWTGSITLETSLGFQFDYILHISLKSWLLLVEIREHLS